MKHCILSGIIAIVALFASCTPQVGDSLPRKEPSKKMAAATVSYIDAVQKAEQDLHSIMVLQDGKVVFEKWMSEGAPEKPHVLFSVSKTFTATAVGFAIHEGLLNLDDKVISFFPDKLPEVVSDNLKAMNIEHLLTMSCGHTADPTGTGNRKVEDWVKHFLAIPVEREPGTLFCYNSMATYMLSAILQKVTGEKVVDYLQPRLFEPLAIKGATWQSCPMGINCGGWGLFLKTEDLAKMGQLFLQEGKWNGKQVVPQDWIKAASTFKIDSVPAGHNSDKRAELLQTMKGSDWLEGYCYQMWRCRNNAYRADGLLGQYIIVLPEKNAVIVTTAKISDMQAELNLIWEHIYPAL